MGIAGYIYIYFYGVVFVKAFVDLIWKWGYNGPMLLKAKLAVVKGGRDESVRWIISKDVEF